MGLDDAFDAYQEQVDADPTQVKEARERRDVFKAALGPQPDVLEAWGSGSLRRSTHTGPKIHDLDLVVVFDQAAHPDWGEPGESAGAALSHLAGTVNTLLGVTNGTHTKLVRIASPRDHAVKCFIDLPGDDDGFTVDAMPALKRDGALLIPENRSKLWVPADPLDLVTRVAKRQEDWDCFLRMVRVLKVWRRRAKVNGKVKSLVMEVLALRHLPGGVCRPVALKAFFTAAAVAVNEPICDPAGLCGEIQPDLDRVGLRDALSKAADFADEACAAADARYTDDALRLWQEVFGSDFPAPKSKPASVGPALITAPAFKRPIKDAPQG
ncbi:MAG TPA: nucleotidyltransferase [Kribbellaceae bacterium]|nr:nucleotidyltransferase [Kribbellaceae bacterium]